MGSAHRRKTAVTATDAVLFLDIDGVLNDATSDEAETGQVDSRLLRRLVEIIRQTECSIVLSSSWRHDVAWCSRFATLLCDAGAKKDIVLDATPEAAGLVTRSHEIRSWL